MNNKITLLAELHEQLLKEIEAEVTALDGTIDLFDIETKSIHITVEPKYQKYIEKLLGEIITKYNNKKDKLFSKNPFSGVERFLNSD